METSNCCIPSKLPDRQHGLALGLILAAVALVATLGVVIAVTSNSNIGWGYAPKNNAQVTALMAEARNLRAGIDVMTSRGTSISSITFDASTTGLFNPSTGGTEFQQPIPGAMTSTTTGWIWKVDGSGNPVVKLYNVGVSANADYVAILPNIDPNTCLQLNVDLNNDKAIPQLTATFSALTTPATSVDLSASTSGSQGWPDGCFEPSDGNSTSGPFVYITTIRAQ